MEQDQRIDSTDSPNAEDRNPGGISSSSITLIPSNNDAQLSDNDPIRADDDPWINVKIDWRDGKDALERKFLEYKPSNNTTKLKGRILLLGPVKSGKSSFYNTLTSALSGDEEVTNNAHIGEAEGSLTKTFQVHTIYDKNGEELMFNLCDAMGFEFGMEGGHNRGLHVDNIGKLLDGHIKENYQFTRYQISNDDPAYNPKPGLRDKVHCVVLAIDGLVCNNLFEDDDMLQKMKKVREEANIRNIPFAVIMTKVDLLSAEVNTMVSKVYRSQNVFEKIKIIENKLSIPRVTILPVRNYHNMDNTIKEIDILALHTCSRLLGYVNGYLQKQPVELEPEPKSKCNIL